MKAIINTKLVMEEGIIWDGALTYDGGKIVQVGHSSEVSVPADAEIIDAGGLYTAPGLVDIHNHGGGEKKFAEDPMYCARYFLAHGVTSVLATFYHDMGMEEMLAGAQRVREASQTGAGRIIEGLYMEGPFMKLIGSQANHIKWQGASPREEYTRLVDGVCDIAKVWAIAPERENIEEIMTYIREKDPRAVFAHGHSSCEAEKVRALEHFGIKVRTHIGDAGQAKGRAQGTPGGGGDQYCLNNPDMYAELICDETGVHVVPELIKMFVRAKGVEKICLISDSMPKDNDYKNSEELGIWYGPDLNYDDMGKLSGSRMTLENGVRNMMTHTGYGLCHSIRMATLNPARLLGIDHRVGSLKAGKSANLIIIDDTVGVKKVILQGETVAENGQLLI